MYSAATLFELTGNNQLLSLSSMSVSRCSWDTGAGEASKRNPGPREQGSVACPHAQAAREICKDANNPWVLG